MPDIENDRIEKTVLIRAPRGRVWRAIADSERFGAWFGMKLESPFVEGEITRGHSTHPGYEHIRAELLIERIEPEHYLSLRWHPFAVDPTIDYTAEPMTLVEFQLEDAEGGTQLTIVESGFDRIPIARRAEAFRMNSQGWSGQAQNIARYVAGE